MRISMHKCLPPKLAFEKLNSLFSFTNLRAESLCNYKFSWYWKANLSRTHTCTLFFCCRLKGFGLKRIQKQFKVSLIVYSKLIFSIWHVPPVSLVWHMKWNKGTPSAWMLLQNAIVKTRCQLLLLAILATITHT